MFRRLLKRWAWSLVKDEAEAAANHAAGAALSIAYQNDTLVTVQGGERDAAICAMVQRSFADLFAALGIAAPKSTADDKPETEIAVAHDRKRMH